MNTPPLQLSLLAGVLILWIGGLIFLELCGSDIIYFLAGRQRWFAFSLNSGFLFVTVILAVRFWNTLRSHLKIAISLPICFVILLLVSGLWTPIAATFAGPPWSDRIEKVPFSAATSYMVDLWAWQIGPPQE
jgi:hypothetical protein